MKPLKSEGPLINLRWRYILFWNASAQTVVLETMENGGSWEDVPMLIRIGCALCRWSDPNYWKHVWPRRKEHRAEQDRLCETHPYYRNWRPCG